MGKLSEIREKLLTGSTTNQLIEQGYAKSSIHHVAKKLEKLQPGTPILLGQTELQDLRHQKEIIKLQKEIAELEATKEKMPERMAALEQTVLELRSLLRDAVDTALFISLEKAGMNREEAKEYADGWVEREIRGEPR